MNSVLIGLGALLPTAGVAFMFYVIIKAMLEGDRNERLAHSKWEAGQERSAPPAERPNNAEDGDSAT